MAQLKHLTLTLNGSEQSLLDAISGATAKDDIPCRQVILQAGGGNVGAIFVGGPGVTTTDFGFRIPAASGGAPVANSEVKLGPYDTGPIKPSGIGIRGTNDEKLHALLVPW